MAQIDRTLNKPTRKEPKSKLQLRREAHRRAIENMQVNKAAISAELRSKLVTPLKVSPEEAATQLNHRCPYCQSLLIPRIETYQILDKERTMFIWPDKCGCDNEAMALKEQAIQAELTQAQLLEQARQTDLARAGLIGWLANVEFGQFEPRSDWPEAMECKTRAVVYFEALEDDCFEIANHSIFKPHKKNWLIMHGHYGNGKTLLAASMVKWFTRGSAYLRVWPDYERRIRATYSAGNDEDGRATETEDDIIRELQQGDFVVIDDLDKRKSTEFTRGVLYSVLNYRYNAELPTVLTFNFGPDEIDKQAPGRLVLETILGPAVLDRIIGSAFDVIEFDGPSYRSGVTW